MSNTNSFGTPKSNGLNIPGEPNPLLVQRVKNMIINKMVEDQPNRSTTRTVTVGNTTITCTNRPGYKPQVYVTSTTSAQVVPIPAASFGSRTKTDKNKTGESQEKKKSNKILSPSSVVSSPKGKNQSQPAAPSPPDTTTRTTNHVDSHHQHVHQERDDAYLGYGGEQVLHPVDDDGDDDAHFWDMAGWGVEEYSRGGDDDDYRGYKGREQHDCHPADDDDDEKFWDMAAWGDEEYNKRGRRGGRKL